MGPILATCMDRELGHDVYYIEDSDDYPTCYDPRITAATTDPTYGLRFAAAALARLGLGDRWAYYDAHASEWKGTRARDAHALCKSADLILSYSGMWGNPLREWMQTVPRRATIDGDPGSPRSGTWQIQHFAGAVRPIPRSLVLVRISANRAAPFLRTDFHGK
jgi:hypothetical protein